MQFASPEQVEVLVPAMEAQAALVPEPLPSQPARAWPQEEAGRTVGVVSLGLVITGTAGGDVLVGGAGNDALLGRAGDDILIGSAGHDTISGGIGHDTLRLGLLRSDAVIDFRAQRISSIEGHDSYDGIEVLDFRDGDWMLATRETGILARPTCIPDPEADLLARLYHLAHDRTPDRTSFLTWLDALKAGRSAESVGDALLAIPGAAETYADGTALVTAAQALILSEWML